jgi:hypothetical protein
MNENATSGFVFLKATLGLASSAAMEAKVWRRYALQGVDQSARSLDPTATARPEPRKETKGYA